MPVQLQSNESEGEVIIIIFQIEEDIVKNESKKFG